MLTLHVISVKGLFFLFVESRLFCGRTRLRFLEAMINEGKCVNISSFKLKGGAHLNSPISADPCLLLKTSRRP